MLMKMRDMMKRKNGQKGFTLIELIVVMAILAVLAAIAVPRYTNATLAAKASAHLANIRTIESAVMMFQANDGDITSLSDGSQLSEYIAEWPDSPGKYGLVSGSVSASPTKAATKAAIDGKSYDGLGF